MTARLSQFMRALSHSDALSMSLLRVLVALACLLLAITDDAGIRFQREPDDIASLLYLIAALGIFGISLSNPLGHYRLYVPVLLFDCFVLTIIPYLGLSSSNDALNVVAAANIVIVLACRVRWTIATTLNVAILLNLVTILVFSSVHPVALADDGMILRRIAFVVVPTLFALWIAGRMGPPRRPSLPVQTFEFDEASLAAIAAAAAARIGCRHVSLEWHASGQDLHSLDHAPALVASVRSLAPGIAVDCAEAGNLAFLLPRSASAPILATTDGWNIARSPRSPEGVPVTIAADGFAARIQGHTGFGLVVATGFPLMAWSDLRSFHALADAILHRLEDVTLNALIHDSELAQVRGELARDLHDSVAQSLAGAKFWLAGLASTATDVTMRSELSRLRDAIEAESVHVRKIVEDLRGGGTGAAHRPLRQVVQDTLGTLGRQWRVRTELSYELDPGFQADAPTAFAIQQILREAVANAVRHGNADLVLVRCVWERPDMVLEISDNGTGFADGTLPRSLSERVSRLVGDLTVSSLPGDTRVSIKLPVGAFLDQGHDNR